MEPVASASEIEALRGYLAEHERALTGCDEHTLNRMLAKLKVMLPTRGLSDGEAALLLDEMIKRLSDIPKDILGNTFAHLVCTRKWFPTIADIREACAVELGKRKWRASKMRMVIKLGPIAEPVVPATPEEVAAIMREFGLRSNPLGPDA